MNCPTCGSPRPEERWCKYRMPVRPGDPGYHPVYPLCCVECDDSYHNQILDSEQREQVLPGLY